MKLLGLFIPPWVLWACAALALAGAFGSGLKVAGWRCAARQVEALERAQRQFNERLKQQQQESELYEAEREQGRIEGRARETEVRTIYRDIPAPPIECAAPDAVRSVLDDAINAANSAAGRQPS